MRKVHSAGPAEVVALGRRSVYEIAMAVDEHWTTIEMLLKKYGDRPISLWVYLRFGFGSAAAMPGHEHHH